MKAAPRVTILVAIDENRVIGNGGAIPWHLPEDMAFLKRTTTGHVVIMGRKTYDSIGRPLPMRRNIVISRSPDWEAPGVERAHSLEEALLACAGESEAFVLGGAQIYAQALPLAQRALVTEIHTKVAGDTFFPALPSDFVETARESHTSAKVPKLRFDFVVYDRRH